MLVIGFPFPLDVRARAPEARVGAPASGRGIEPAARRLVGLRGGGHLVARPRPQPADRGVRARRHPALREGPPGSGDRAGRAAVPGRRLRARAAHRQDGLRGRGGGHRAGGRAAVRRGRDAGRRHQAEPRAAQRGVQRDPGRGRAAPSAGGERFRGRVLPVDPGDRAPDRPGGVCGDEGGSRPRQHRPRGDRRRGGRWSPRSRRASSAARRSTSTSGSSTTPRTRASGETNGCCSPRTSRPLPTSAATGARTSSSRTFAATSPARPSGTSSTGRAATDPAASMRRLHDRPGQRTRGRALSTAPVPPEKTAIIHVSSSPGPNPGPGADHSPSAHARVSPTASARG